MAERAKNNPLSLLPHNRTLHGPLSFAPTSFPATLSRASLPSSQLQQIMHIVVVVSLGVNDLE